MRSPHVLRKLGSLIWGWSEDSDVAISRQEMRNGLHQDGGSENIMGRDSLRDCETTYW